MALQYAPTRQENLLENGTRSSILNLLKSANGMTATQIQRALNLGWGSTQHHLYLLQRANIITSHANGGLRVFFPKETSLSHQVFATTLFDARTRLVASVLLGQPGVRQKDLCSTTGLTRKVLCYHVERLVAAGLAVKEGTARHRRYQPTPLLASRMG